MKKAIGTHSLTPFLTTVSMAMNCKKMMHSSFPIMEGNVERRPPKDGKFSSSGRMDPLAGKPSKILKRATLYS